MMFLFPVAPHVFKDMHGEPVHAPVQQMAGQQVGRHAGIGEQADGPLPLDGGMEGRQVVAAVQGKADDVMPGQAQTGAGLLQGADPGQDAHGVGAQLAQERGADAVEQGVSVGQHHHFLAAGAPMADAGQHRFQRRGQGELQGGEVVEGRQQATAAAQDIGLFDEAQAGGGKALARGQGAVQAKDQDRLGRRAGRLEDEGGTQQVFLRGPVVRIGRGRGRCRRRVGRTGGTGSGQADAGEEVLLSHVSLVGKERGQGAPGAQKKRQPRRPDAGPAGGRPENVRPARRAARRGRGPRGPRGRR